MKNMSSNNTVGFLAAQNHQNIQVFKNIGIDYWCQSFKTLEEAATDIGVPVDVVTTALAEVPVHKNKTIEKFHSWDVEALIDYIVTEHHEYSKSNLILIYDLTRKVIYRNQETRSELNNLATEVFLFIHDLLNHMAMEERVLFPGIKKLIQQNHISGKYEYSTFGLMEGWISRLEKEHLSACRYLKSFNQITNDYDLTRESCELCIALYEKMKEFEENFLLHLHLENNILFPKALTFENLRV